MLSITARGWGWQFASRNTPALSGVNFTIEPGERVLLLGASGVGKSTLLRAIAGVLGEDEGTAQGTLLVGGETPHHARGKVGLVLQDPENQIILERVGDDAAFGCENLGIARDEIWTRVEQALAQVGLELPLDHSTARLSGGQKQRLAIAGNMAMRPGLIALDEPTANLDPQGVTELVRALAQVAEETAATVVMVEHRVDVWWDFVTRVIVLDHEGVLWDCAPREIPASMASVLSSAGVWLPGQRSDVPHRESSTASEVLLSARELRAGYAGGAPGPEVSCEVRSGEIVAITGANGVGKTALALTLGGLVPPHAGEVVASPALQGSVRSSQPIMWKSRELLPRIGNVFQAPEHQFVAGTVRAELAVGPRALGWPDTEISAWVEELLTRLHLLELADAHPFTLSGGQQRRLSVGTALAAKPRLLILDEPTFGQDALTWREIVLLCAQLRDEGHGIVVVTHDEAFVRAVADTVLELRENS